MFKPREIHIEPAGFMVKPSSRSSLGPVHAAERRLARHAERRDGSVKPKNDAER